MNFSVWKCSYEAERQWIRGEYEAALDQRPHRGSGRWHGRRERLSARRTAHSRVRADGGQLCNQPVCSLHGNILAVFKITIHFAYFLQIQLTSLIIIGMLFFTPNWLRLVSRVDSWGRKCVPDFVASPRERFQVSNKRYNVQVLSISWRRQILCGYYTTFLPWESLVIMIAKIISSIKKFI